MTQVPPTTTQRNILRGLACYPMVLEKLKAGIACENIAEWIQVDRQEYLGTTRNGVIRALYRHKAKLPPSVMATVAPLSVYTKIEKLRRNVNELEELEKLYLLQLTRISAAVDVEDKIKFPNSKLWKDIELAKNLLIDAANLKMELGIYKRSATQIGVTGLASEEHTKLLDDLEPEKRRNLGLAAAKILEALQAAAGAVPTATATVIDETHDEETVEAEISDRTDRNDLGCSEPISVAVSVPVGNR